VQFSVQSDGIINIILSTYKNEQFTNGLHGSKVCSAAGSSSAAQDKANTKADKPNNQWKEDIVDYILIKSFAEYY